MYVVVDDRASVGEGYVLGFAREGIAALSFSAREFADWLETLPDREFHAVQGVLIGEADGRAALPRLVVGRGRVPVIAIEDHKSLERTLDLFNAGADDIVRKPVHVREIVARCAAIWRRLHAPDVASTFGRLTVYFDNRDPRIDGEPLALPRRERQILEYLVKNRHRRVSKTQLFNAIYGLFNDNVDETVIEGHVSKLRRKLRERLGHDLIHAKRYAGYCFVEAPDGEDAPEPPRATPVDDAGSRPHVVPFVPRDAGARGRSLGGLL